MTRLIVNKLTFLLALLMGWIITVFVLIAQQVRFHPQWTP